MDHFAFWMNNTITGTIPVKLQVKTCFVEQCHLLLKACKITTCWCELDSQILRANQAAYYKKYIILCYFFHISTYMKNWYWYRTYCNFEKKTFIAYERLTIFFHLSRFASFLVKLFSSTAKDLMLIIYRLEVNEVILKIMITS